MAFRVQLGRKALRDIDEAVLWYKARSRRTARRFLEEYQAARDLILESPERWPLIDEDLRKLPLRTFPYSMIYSVSGEIVLVYAVAHAKRAPYW